MLQHANATCVTQLHFFVMPHASLCINGLRGFFALHNAHNDTVPYGATPFPKHANKGTLCLTREERAVVLVCYIYGKKNYLQLKQTHHIKNERTTMFDFRTGSGSECNFVRDF